MATHKLTDLVCRTAKPTDKTQKLADGYGLYLEVTPKGSKLWRFRYRYERKFKLISLGIYPFVTLSEARAALADCKRLLDRGIDPSKKTGKCREVVLSPGLGEMLQALHEQRNPKLDDLIFPAPRGGPMDDHNFRGRAWKTVLNRLGIDYRKPYSTRHTAVSHALANGADPLQVASQSGHNPQILYKNYASVIQSKSIFVDFC